MRNDYNDKIIGKRFSVLYEYDTYTVLYNFLKKRDGSLVIIRVFC